MDIYESDGIILNNFNIKDNSKIIKIYTRKFGRVDLLCRGFNSIKSNLTSLDVFNEVYVEFYIVGEYFYLKDIDIISSNYTIRKSNLNIVFGNIVLEILEKVFPMYFPEVKIYELTITFFKRLQENHNNYLLLLGYILKFLAYNGYRLDLSSCSSCGKNDNDKYYYSLDNLNINCGNCSKGYNVYMLTYTQLKLLNILIYSKFSEFPNIEYEDNFYLLDILVKTIYKIFEIGKINSINYLGFYKRGLYEK